MEIAPNNNNNEPLPSSLCFLAIADWGDFGSTVQTLADAMHRHVTQSRVPVKFILSVGDNFYPMGVTEPTYDDDDGNGLSSAEFLFWEKVFLSRFDSLRVPWKVVLGNHDLAGGCAEAQLQFTLSSRNPQRLWQCAGDDGKPARCFSFDRRLIGGHRVHFTGFDSNACQFGCMYSEPDIRERFPEKKEWLRGNLRDAAGSLWKIFFAHHPFFTQGKGHQDESVCLRTKKYLVGSREFAGLDLLNVLYEGNVDVVIAGHEHVMQAHRSEKDGHVMWHFGVGASTECSFYRGKFREKVVDWYDPSAIGFGSFEVSVDEAKRETTLKVRFIHAITNDLVKEIELKKKLP